MLLALWATLAGWAFLSLHLAVPALRVGLYLLPISLYLWVLVDAVLLAKRSPADYVLRRYNRVWAYALAVLLVGVVAHPAFTSFVKARIARAYSAPSDAMRPTLAPGDYLLASRGVPSSIERGSILVWHSPEGIEIIQRAVALPGDTVEMRAKSLFVNGRAVREPYVRHIDPNADVADPQMLWQREFLAGRSRESYRPTRDTWGPLAVPAGHYLLLGDNRDNSYDGRYRGFVRRDWITGQPVWVYLSRDPETGRFRWSRSGMSIR
jgi:signal peptidase I